MYDNAWNTQFTEFNIVEKGDVPLLMSLPQMRNLGFQFELTPFVLRTYWHEKMVLKTGISTHLILDLQDVAWYVSEVHFKTPQVKSSFSQHDHFEYSQIAVKQDVQEEEEEEKKKKKKLLCLVTTGKLMDYVVYSSGITRTRE